MNKNKLQELIQFIINNNGIGSKDKLSKLTKEKFNLIVDRKIYYCEDFAIRFSQANKRAISNTILSLSALQKYDKIPVICCAVLPNENYMLLCNTTCLKKISHSSQQLRIDNIKGSFNHSDILKNICGIDNIPLNFQKLFEIHSAFKFEENLTRLVEETNGIIAHGKRFNLSTENEHNLITAPQRAKNFIASKYYHVLNDDLTTRVEKVKNEIAIAAFIENVNVKGNIIEYLITNNGGLTKQLLIDALVNDKPLPPLKNVNDLGDYNISFDEYKTKTDIKTKVLFLGSNPKAYNIDKLLDFLATDKSVYLLYFVGVDKNKDITTYLCSVFDSQLLKETRIISHWAGRNSRGVAQFNGDGIVKILRNKYSNIDLEQAKLFINQIIEL